MRTKKKLAAEVESLREELNVVRAQLEAVQAEQLRALVAGLGRERWTWPKRVDESGFITPIMGVVNAPQWYWAEEDRESFEDDDDTND